MTALTAENMKSILFSTGDFPRGQLRHVEITGHIGRQVYDDEGSVDAFTLKERANDQINAMKTPKELTALIQVAKSTAGITEVLGGYERNSTTYPGELDEAAVSMLTDADEGDREELTALCDLLDELKGAEEIEVASECNATLAADSDDNARLNAEATANLVITKTGAYSKYPWVWTLTRPGKTTISGYHSTKREALSAGQFEERLEDPRFAKKVANQWEAQRSAREGCLLGLNAY